MKKGFDSERYIECQSVEVLKRLNVHDRLYLEFGGKLLNDSHAFRVLPGYKRTTKIDFLKSLGNLEMIYCVNAKDIESNKVLGDFRLTYENQALKDIKNIKKTKLKVSYVVITRYDGEKKALRFKRRLEKMGQRVFFHFEIPGYPNDIKKVLEGYLKQSYLPIKKKLVVVTGAAGGSGKMAVCLSQIYHELKEKKNSSFIKFETFPVWDLPLNHPINFAYEAATADLQDKNIIDPYYKKKYGKRAVNYNRDIENFEILQKIISKMTRKNFLLDYNSPTEMGANMVSHGIIDDKVCRRAAIKEINRRYKVYYNEFLKGRESAKTIKRMKEILRKVKGI